MKSINRTAYVLLFTFLLLFSGGCTDTVEADHSSSSSAPPLASSGDTGEGSLNILASFQREDGSPLTEQSIRLSAGDKSAEYPLDEWGELRVSGLPRKMTLEVTVLDKESGPRGTITISFSEGTVIDASTDQEGAGYVVVKEDTEAVDLLFVLCDDGSIQCDLDLGRDIA